MLVPGLKTNPKLGQKTMAPHSLFIVLITIYTVTIVLKHVLACLTHCVHHIPTAPAPPHSPLTEFVILRSREVQPEPTILALALILVIASSLVISLTLIIISIDHNSFVLKVRTHHNYDPLHP